MSTPNRPGGVTVVSVLGTHETPAALARLTEQVRAIAMSKPSTTVRWVKVYRGALPVDDGRPRRDDAAPPNLHGMSTFATRSVGIADARERANFLLLPGEVIHLDPMTAHHDIARTTPVRHSHRDHLRADLIRLRRLVGV